MTTMLDLALYDMAGRLRSALNDMQAVAQGGTLTGMSPQDKIESVARDLEEMMTPPDPDTEKGRHGHTEEFDNECQQCSSV